ncbi:MAG: hypothetical protein ACOH5I_24365 [Oligoflexus sp.]
MKRLRSGLATSDVLLAGLMEGGLVKPANAASEDWPQVKTSIPKDDAMEERIEGILKRLSLAEKLGQVKDCRNRRRRPLFG